ncbi:unnamed protein product, partial [Discosporangium mesarthrocarpum]
VVGENSNPNPVPVHKPSAEFSNGIESKGGPGGVGGGGGAMGVGLSVARAGGQGPLTSGAAVADSVASSIGTSIALGSQASGGEDRDKRLGEGGGGGGGGIGVLPASGSRLGHGKDGGPIVDGNKETALPEAQGLIRGQ